MLVISRQPWDGKDTILVGQDIKVVITRVDHQTVRVGIIAPRSIPIVREELTINDPLPKPKETSQ